MACTPKPARRAFRQEGWAGRSPRELARAQRQYLRWVKGLARNHRIRLAAEKASHEPIEQ